MLISHGSFDYQFAGVFGVDRFEQQHRCAVFGDGVVLDAFGDDEHLAFAKMDRITISHLDGELTFEDKEELVFVFVAMPGELAFEFGEFDLLPVELPDDFGCPSFIEEAEFVGEVDDVTHTDFPWIWCRS